jgi:hypothetical protein
MSDQTDYRIYCNTESVWVTAYSNSALTQCPNSNLHLVNLNSVQDVINGTSALYGVITSNSTINSTSVGVGSFLVLGGLSVAKGTSLGGICTLYDTTVSTSTSTGSLVINGGMGIVGAAYFGSTFNVAGIATITNTTQSTSTSTGSLVISGGLGVAKNVTVGGTLDSIGGRNVNITVQSANYTVLVSDHYIACNTTSAGFTLTLPSAATAGIGTMYVISKSSNDTNTLIISAAVSQTIGNTNQTFTTSVSYSFLTIVADTTSNWQIVSYSAPTLGSSSNYTYPYGGVYGMGILGNVTISSNTSLSQNSYYNNLTINSGVTLNPNGWAIFVANTLTFVDGNSTIATNGSNASSTTAGNGGGTYADLVAQTNTTYLGGGLAGCNGRTTSGAGIATTTTNQYTTNNVSVAGSGGNGGNSSGNSGSAAALVPNPSIANGWIYVMDTFPNSLGRCILLYYNIAFNGATGGGGGGLSAGTGTTLKSGAGGGGAGVIVISARIIAASSGGRIQAIGGNGSNATAGTLGTASIGGGGSGGGGIISVITSTPWSSLSLTTSVAAGTPGTGLGTGGVSGSNGTSGRLIINQI